MKQRTTLYMTPEAVDRLALVANYRKGAKSAIVEEALDRYLNPERNRLLDDAVLRRHRQPVEKRLARGPRRGHRDRDAVAVRPLLPDHHAAAAAGRAGRRPRATAGSGSRRSSPRSAGVWRRTTGWCPRCWNRSPRPIPICSRRRRTIRRSRRRRRTVQPSLRPRRAPRPIPHLGRTKSMGDLFSLAAMEAEGRRRQMLRTAFGPAIAAALADPGVIEVMVNPDGRLWLDKAGSGRSRYRRATRRRRGRAHHPARRRPRASRGARRRADRFGRAARDAASASRA